MRDDARCVLTVLLLLACTLSAAGAAMLALAAAAAAPPPTGGGESNSMGAGVDSIGTQIQLCAARFALLLTSQGPSPPCDAECAECALLCCSAVDGRQANTRHATNM